MSIEKLFIRFKIPCDKHLLQKMLTHSSFAQSNNSRCVFLGQYVFRGIVADWVFNNIAGTGTQLQHYLGNLLSAKRLDKCFDTWQISKIRIANQALIDSQKHIFVYAVLGYVYENATEEQLGSFVFKQFIKPADHLLPSVHKHNNPWDEFVFLCKQNYDCKPKVTIVLTDDKINIVTITVKNNEFAKQSSVSYKYARKKTIREALKKIVLDIEAKTIIDPVFIANEQKRAQKIADDLGATKQAIQEKHVARNQKHAAKMAIRRDRMAIEAAETDKKRKIAKENVKAKTSRKGADTIYRSYTTDEIAAMSASKRRNLQDKGIIPKGI